MRSHPGSRHSDAYHLEVQRDFDPHVLFDDRRHAAPHVHAEYSEFRAAVNILTGETLSGCLPPRQTRLLQKWIQLRQTELLNDWTLAVAGRPLQPIEPLDA